MRWKFLDLGLKCTERLKGPVIEVGKKVSAPRESALSSVCDMPRDWKIWCAEDVFVTE